LIGQINANTVQTNLLGLQNKAIPSDISGKINIESENTFGSLDKIKIDMNDLCLTKTDGTEIRVGNLFLSRLPVDRGSSYTFVSDFAKGELVSDMSFNQIADVIIHQIQNQLPALIVERPTTIPTHSNAYCRFNIDLTDTKLLSNFLDNEIAISQPANIKGTIMPDANYSTISVFVPSVEIDGGKYENASVFFSSRQDSLTANVMLTKFFGDKPVRIENKLIAEDNHLLSESLWQNTTEEGTHGSLKTQTEFCREGAKLSLKSHILPSKFYISDTLWQISPANIYFCGKDFNLDNLKISRGNEFINMNASLDESGKKDLLLELNDIEVSYLLMLANFKPVQFSGKATGIVKNKDNNVDFVSADLTVTDFCFNTGPMGKLQANAVFDTKNVTLDFDAKTQRDSNDSTIINGAVDIKNKNLDINIKAEKTNLQFLNKYVGRFIADLEGNTSGDFRLFGSFKYVNMEGSQRINYLQFRPKMLGAMYRFENQPVTIKPDSIDMTGMVLRDVYGNTAKIKGGVYHNSLFAFNYNFGINLNDFLMLNWEEDPSRAFWGTVFADGILNLHGNTRVVYLDGELSTAGQPGSSVLFYTSETASAGSDADYIHYVTPEEKYSSAIKESIAEQNPNKDTSSDVFMNFKFNVNSDATLNIITDPKTKDFMSLNGNGPIRMSYYNKGKFELNGLYSVVGGSYWLTIKDLIRRRFAMQPGGYLRFNGNPSEGDLLLKGIHTINSVSMSDLNVGASQSNSTIGVDCILNFTGKASDPKVSFDLDFPNANSDENQLIKKLIFTEEDRNMQVVYLLSIGRFYTYNYETFNSGGQSQSSLAMSSFLAGTLSSQINNVLQDAFNISNWNFGTNISTGRMGFNDMEVQGSLSGKMFNNRLLFNGNFGYRDQATTYSNNFVGDFNLQWLLNKSGTISLKAYSETNDRYFTKSSLTTQGGGILFQKDFNKFWEFFTRKKYR